jgi:hypothetical protein
MSFTPGLSHVTSVQTYQVFDQVSSHHPWSFEGQSLEQNHHIFFVAPDT